MATEGIPQLRILQELHRSQYSQVHLVECSGATYDKAVRKIRLEGSDFEVEVSIHQAMEACSSLFPKVLYFDLDTRTMLLEHCHKGTLETLMATMNEPWRPKRVYNFLVQLMVGLVSLHRLAYAHQDLKPSRILIGHKKIPKLTGFRKARIVTISSGYYDDACIGDLSDLGRALTDLITRNIALSAQDMSVYYAQFPPVFREVMTALQSQSELRTKKAVDLLTMLAEQSIDDTLADRASWLFPETAELLQELRLEKSLSLSVVCGESKKYDKTITGISTINSFHDSVMQESSVFPGSFQRSIFIVGKTIGELTSKTLSDNFSVMDTSILCKMLANEHDQLKGRFIVSVQDRKWTCQGNCAQQVLASSSVKLQCGHRFCSKCLNAHLEEALAASAKYSQLQCPRCKQQFVPLEESIVRHLPPELVTNLTDSYLRETTKPCPKCKFLFEVGEFSSPVCIKCPSCKYGVCSYCFNKSHSFSCSKFKKDNRLKG